MTLRPRAALLVLLAAPVLGGPPAAQDALAILSDRCFACHGPDAATREAELRLDTRAGVFGDRGGYAPVVPGDVDASELIFRVGAEDDERMPPTDSGLALSTEEIETLVAWVEAGAPWDEHWSFVPPGEVDLPAVQREDWVRDPLDRFVLARLEREGLEPAEPADPARLLRRVTLDLSGLPPTPDEVAAFVADPSDAAYAATVERLLASPRYGERMAWEWLDAARYADTDGFQADPTRDMWPWRDWLVDALNRNLPFDQLSVEMLAGDLLPDATPEQVLASGFHRNHPYNGEGGRIPEETRVENVFDRVETTGTIWLGLTVGCARCHDHKFDPIAQEDYYGFYDFFNQTSESGAEGQRGRAAPVLRYLSGDERARADAVAAEIVALELRQEAPDATLDAEQRAWEARVVESLRTEPAHSATATFGPWHRTDVLPAPDGDGSRAFDHVFAPERGVDLEARGEDGESLWRAEEALADGVAFALSDAVGATYLVRDLSVPSERSLVLSLGSDDSIRAWLDGEEVLANDAERGVAPDQERVELDVSAGAHRLLFKIVNTGGPGGFYFRVAEERALGLPPALLAALERPVAERRDEDRRALKRAYRSRHASGWSEAEMQLAELRAERQRLRDGAPAVMVMDQLPEDRRRETRLLHRGSYDQPRQAVAPHTPGFLPDLPEGAPRDRLTLARWLLAPEHPLTARVTVNRAWQTLFGRGLVPTPEDFGRQGDAPSHPDLLDWLARELVASGWDMKALHRRMVLCATYRQSATRGRDEYEADPDNVLLARSARQRLPAWMLRDQALALAGLLALDLGGPPVRPYQPDGVWAEATFGQIRYTQDQGEDLYRRSLYVFWRRIVGPTVFFDSAKRQTCEVRPSRTNTPLHALVTLNETAYVEAARKFAERAFRAGESDADRIAWAFRTATARSPDPEELAVLSARHASARAAFVRVPEDAAALLAVGESAADVTIPAPDLAAHAVVCSVILNLDEVLTRP